MIRGLDRVVIATTKTDAMAAFCRTVLGAELTAVQAAGHTMYDGTCGPFAWLLCPVALAGVDAKDTRHQLRLIVDDTAAIAARARHAGAPVETESTLDDMRSYVIVRDPDGNAWEFVSQ